MTAMTIKNHEDWKEPLVKICQRVLNQYTIMMTQCAASLASMADRKETSNDLILHIFTMMIPHSKVKKLCERTDTDWKLLGIPTKIPSWNRKLEILFCEGTGRVNPCLRPIWESTFHDKRWYENSERDRYFFEIEHERFTKLSIIDKTFDIKEGIEFNYFYKYIISAWIPDGQNSKVADITFVNVDRQRYGVPIVDLVFDGQVELGDFKGNEPGIVINEIITDRERTLVNRALCFTHPVPHIILRSKRLIEKDLSFLDSLGMKQMISHDRCSFEYFLSIQEVINMKDIIKSIDKTKYDLCYVYVALDDWTCFIQLVVSKIESVGRMEPSKKR